MLQTTAVPLERVDACRWRIPASYEEGMRVPGLVFADEKLLKDIAKDQALQQVANVAHLPGIVGYSLAMPDIHLGYGFPIGGVAAVDADEGVISPGGVGYDINCGVRLVRTRLHFNDVHGKIDRIADHLFNTVPCGVGSQGAIPSLSIADERRLTQKGARWAIENGFGRAEDLDHTEENGCLAGADADALSETALKRGSKQVGTLGSGNHFLELGRVDTVFRPDVAGALGIEMDQVIAIIHSGSRGLGYQTCDDHLRVMGRAMEKYGIRLPDRQLACAPIKSPEGQRYLAAMACAANYAWVNRQVMMSLLERALMESLAIGPRDLGLSLIYDVCHNVAKFETHEVEGVKRKLCVHRKGATRAFGPGHPAIPATLRPVGQPVLIPGDMGRYSFLLVGTAGAMKETFGSTCHGAGRVMSRTQSKKESRGHNLEAELAERGVTVRHEGRGTLAEEMPHAYKDVAEVVEVMEHAGVSNRVARFKPFAVIKG
jgi:tRNA-splicing ligase RtcB